MTTSTIAGTNENESKDIAITLFRLGATSYGGPAIMGVMQAELQERRRWVSKERFLEGLAVANMVPGATATQLGIFLAYARGGWWGGLLGGLSFVSPAFVIMLALTIGYATFGVTPLARSALYGLGPVVIGLFAIALYRLGKTAASTVPEAIIGLAAAAALATTRLGIVAILVLAGCAGLLLFYRGKSLARVRALSGLVVLAVLATVWWTLTSAPSSTGGGWTPNPKSLLDLGLYFLNVGAFTIAGGLTMIAFIQDQVVGQFGWLTPREFIDGLALGQLTPGPVLMIAAYVGYKLAGLAGAAVAATAAFLPSFVIMLAILPILDRVRQMTWVKAVTKGMSPAVIGVLAVSLVRLSPAAIPDPSALAILIVTVIAAMAFHIGAFKLMLGGAIAGVLRSQLPLGALTRHF
ncbi:MAG: chromate efflux transporter [Betaproteobacteria bacterium]|nr:MAG: chromate efflux transporter [Betaproteobacteria bacterium]